MAERDLRDGLWRQSPCRLEGKHERERVGARPVARRAWLSAMRSDRSSGPSARARCASSSARSGSLDRIAHAESPASGHGESGASAAACEKVRSASAVRPSRARANPRKTLSCTDAVSRSRARRYRSMQRADSPAWSVAIAARAASAASSGEAADARRYASAAEASAAAAASSCAASSARSSSHRASMSSAAERSPRSSSRMTMARALSGSPELTYLSAASSAARSASASGASAAVPARSGVGAPVGSPHAQSAPQAQRAPLAHSHATVRRRPRACGHRR